MARPEDQILDTLTNNGIGVSGLAQREIGQSNLPDLSRVLNESQATMANLEDQRNSAFKTKVIGSRASSVFTGGVGVPGGGPDAPALSIFNQTPASGLAPGTDNSVPQFLVNNSGSNEAIGLKTFDDLVNYIKGNPALVNNSNGVLSGLQNLSQDQITLLSQYGIKPTSALKVKQLSNSGESLSKGFNAMTAGHVSFTPQENADKELFHQASVINARNTITNNSSNGKATINFVKPLGRR